MKNLKNFNYTTTNVEKDVETLLLASAMVLTDLQEHSTKAVNLAFNLWKMIRRIEEETGRQIYVDASSYYVQDHCV